MSKDTMSPKKYLVSDAKKMPDAVYVFYSSHKHALCVCEEELPSNFKAMTYLSAAALEREINSIHWSEWDGSPRDKKDMVLALVRRMAGEEQT